MLHPKIEKLFMCFLRLRIGRSTATVAALLVLSLTPLTAHAADEISFQGKTITMIIGYGEIGRAHV